MKTKIAASLVFVGVAVLVAVAAYLTQLAPSAPGDSDPDAVVYSGRLDSYLAVAPAILRAGQTENISVSLFDGAEPAQGTVQLALMQDGVPVAQTNEFVQGVASVPLTVPALGDGDPGLSPGNTDYFPAPDAVLPTNLLSGLKNAGIRVDTLCVGGSGTCHYMRRFRYSDSSVDGADIDQYIYGLRNRPDDPEFGTLRRLFAKPRIPYVTNSNGTPVNQTGYQLSPTKTE